jgi:hypothetical protein
MSKARYLKIALADGTRFILRITRDSPDLISGIEVDADGDEIVPQGVNSKGVRYTERVRHIMRTLVKKTVEMRMNNTYATLEPVPTAATAAKATAKLVNLVTDTATLAKAMYPGGGLDAFNTGAYAGTRIPIRKLTGREIVTIAGTTSGAKVLSDETWIVDRFGELGARQIKQLRQLVEKRD